MQGMEGEQLCKSSKESEADDEIKEMVVEAEQMAQNLNLIITDIGNCLERWQTAIMPSERKSKINMLENLWH